MKKLFCTLIFSTFILFSSVSVNAQTWEHKESGTNFNLFDVSIPKGQNSVAYAGGSEFTSENAPGIIVKSTDAGETWETVYEGDNIQTISFPTSEIGFVGGYNGVLKKTIDGGDNWEDITVGTDVYLYKSIRFYNENIGIIVLYGNVSGVEIYRTIDGGDNWLQSENPPMLGVQKISYADENTLYAVGNGSSVYKSTDGGNNWTQISGSGSSINLGVSFKDNENGIYAGEEGDLYVTHDAGATWSQNLFTGFHFFQGLLYHDNYIIAAGSEEEVYLSTDDGETFNLAYNGEGESSLSEVSLFSDNSGLISGSQGVIIKFDEVILATSEMTDEQISIYPNPTSNVVNIQNSNNIELVEILDLNGKILYRKNVSGKSFQADLSSFTAGVYLLKVTANGKVNVQKIIKK